MTLDKNYCWITFKYIKPLQLRITPVLKDIEGYIAVSMKAKEALVRKSAFLKLLAYLTKHLNLFSGVTHKTIMEKAVSQSLMI